MLNLLVGYARTSGIFFQNLFSSCQVETLVSSSPPIICRPIFPFGTRILYSRGIFPDMFNEHVDF